MERDKIMRRHILNLEKHTARALQTIREADKATGGTDIQADEGHTRACSAFAKALVSICRTYGV